MKAPLHVLIISQHFWPEEFRVNDLPAELKSRDVEVTILTGWPNYPDGKVSAAFRDDPESFSTLEHARIVRVPLIPRGKGGGLRLALNYLSFALAASTIGLFRLRTQRFDAVLVFLSSPATQALPAIILRRLTGVPVWLWVQDLWPQSLSAVGAVRSRAVLDAVGLVVGALYRGSSHILIQSEAFREDVRKRAGSGIPVDYLPNWSEPTVARTGAAIAVAPEVEPYQGFFKIMFAGNLGEAQDLASVIQAAQLAWDREDIRWLMVGDGRARTRAEGLVAELGLQERVVFLGRQPSHRMPEFFAGADALLVSLRDEPIFSLTVPSKVQSYLAAERPILAMLNGEGARVIEESGGGIVVPAGDAGALASAAIALSDLSETERAGIARRGRLYANAQFDRTQLVDRLLGWMRAMQGSATGRRSRRGS